MTRHRNGDSLSIFLCNGARPPQKTPITVGLEALRELAEEALAAPASYFILTVSEEMLPVFKYELATAFSEIKMKIGERLVLKTGETMKEGTYLIHSTSKPFNY